LKEVMGMGIETYYASAYPNRGLRRGKKIELKYPSDAIPMIAEYLDGRYEVYGLLENEAVDETDEDRWMSEPLRFRHRDYDSRGGSITLLDDWGEAVWEVAVVCEEYGIYWPWVERWAEEIFELHLLPLLKDPYFEWTWKKNKPGTAAKVWNRRNLLRACREHADRFGGIWDKRYAKLLAAQLRES
jgi:hypothetical protein